MTSMGPGSRKRLHHNRKRDLLRTNPRGRMDEAQLSWQRAEKRRESAETARRHESELLADEEEKRLISEEMRSSAEVGREFAEKERSRQELRRQKAETLRTGAEDARKAAEELRVLTEEARRTAELLREAYVEQLEVFREMRRTLEGFDQAARAYNLLNEEMKREQSFRRQKGF